jgi:pimeloyl-ACP methyl ester carboxylesterase
VREEDQLLVRRVSASTNETRGTKLHKGLDIRAPALGYWTRGSLAVVVILSLFLPSWSSSGLAADDPPCRAGPTTTVDFSPGTLPFPTLTNITDQFSQYGIIFSDDDEDLEPEFQKSLGPQENHVNSGFFFNLFRMNFLPAAQPVASVTVTFVDHNVNPQIHTLTAFDSSGKVVDDASFTEDGEFPDPFTLTLSSCEGIAFVVAIEQPIGAERVVRIEFTRGVPEPPAALTNVRTIPGNQMVDLRWDSDSDQVAGWNVYMREEGTTEWFRIPSFREPADPAVPTTAALGFRVNIDPRNGERLLENGVPYEFSVTAVDDLEVEGDMSDIVSAVPRTGNPSDKKPPFPILFLHGLVADAGAWDLTKQFLAETWGWRFGGEMEIIPYDGVCTFEGPCPRFCTFEEPCSREDSRADTVQVNGGGVGDFYTATFGDSNANYGNGDGITQQGREVDAFLLAMRNFFPMGQKFAIVGHSMGGLAARSYEAGLGDVLYRNNIGQLVTTGTPFQGSPLAELLRESFFPAVIGQIVADIDPFGDAVRDLEPDSVFLNELLARPLRNDVQYNMIVNFFNCGSRLLNRLGSSDCVVAADSQNLRNIVHSDHRARIGGRTANRMHFSEHNFLFDVSGETEDYTSIVCSLGIECGTVEAMSPVDLDVMAPDGARITKHRNELPGASYEEIDAQADGDPHDLVTVPLAGRGEYAVRVIPESGADPNDTFTLELTVDGVTTVLAENQRIQDIAAEPFSFAAAEIDILPGSDKNQILVRRKGVVPVAILGGGSFDASLVDPNSLTFGATGDEASRRHCGGLEDADGDGILDLVCQFNIAATGFAVGDVQGRLKGEMFDGSPVLGADRISTR